MADALMNESLSDEIAKQGLNFGSLHYKQAPKAVFASGKPLFLKLTIFTLLIILQLCSMCMYVCIYVCIDTHTYYTSVCLLEHFLEESISANFNGWH